jgi:SAM-dependent methyltransferase
MSNPAGSGIPGARADRDIFRLAPSLDAATLDLLVNRLEFRGSDARYIQISQAYFDQLPLDGARLILSVGCGTGLEVRALKRRIGTKTEIVGIDHSPALVAAAEQLTRAEGLTDGVRYQIGDAHQLPVEDASVDIVLLHTLLSHVDDPLQVLREARRVLRPGGTVAIFDGDYASLTFAYPDAGRAKQIEEALLSVVVANPRVMRELPRLLADAGLDLVSGNGLLYADIGTGGFFANMTEAFGAVLARSGLLPTDMVEDWQRYHAKAVATHTFFGASNYYTYLARRPSEGLSASG